MNPGPLQTAGQAVSSSSKTRTVLHWLGKVPPGLWLALAVVFCVLAWRSWFLAPRSRDYEEALQEIASVGEFGPAPVSNHEGTSLCYTRVGVDMVDFCQLDLRSGKRKVLFSIPEHEYETRLYEVLGWSPRDQFFAYSRKAAGSEPKRRQEIVICDGASGAVRQRLPVAGAIAEWLWLEPDAFAYANEARELHVVEEQANQEWKETKQYQLSQDRDADRTESTLSLTRFESEAIALSAPLPAPWASRDVGQASAAGNATCLNGVFVVEGSGTNLWNAPDELHFVYQRVSGDVDIRARVASVARTHPAAKAGVMLRETLETKSRQANVALTPSRGLVFRGFGTNFFNTNLAQLKAPCWVRLTRTNDIVTAFRSPNGTNWTPVGSEVKLPMTKDLYVGLAVTSFTNGTLCSGTFDHVRVAAQAAPPPAEPVKEPVARPSAPGAADKFDLAWQEKGTIWALNLATGRRKPLANLSTQNLGWLNYSPEARRFFYCVPESGARPLYSFDPYTPASQPQLLSFPREMAFNGRSIAGGQGFAYVGWGGLVVKTHAKAPPAQPFKRGAVRSFRLAPQGDRLYAIAAQGSEPMGLWEYHLDTTQARCLVPGLDKPFRHAKVMKSVRGTAPQDHGADVPFYLVPPAHFDRSRKYPMVIDGPSQDRWGHYAQVLANANIYYVSVDRFGLASADFPETAAEDILAVYRYMSRRPNVDASRIYLSAFSRATVSLQEVLRRSPECWKGALVMNPGVLPTLPDGTPQQKPPARFPDLLISAGAGEARMIPMLEKFEQAACEAGVYSRFMIHANAGHNFRSRRLLLERGALVVDFVSRP